MPPIPHVASQEMRMIEEECVYIPAFNSRGLKRQPGISDPQLVLYLITCGWNQIRNTRMTRVLMYFWCGATNAKQLMTFRVLYHAWCEICQAGHSCWYGVVRELWYICIYVYLVHQKLKILSKNTNHHSVVSSCVHLIFELCEKPHVYGYISLLGMGIVKILLFSYLYFNSTLIGSFGYFLLKVRNQR